MTKEILCFGFLYVFKLVWKLIRLTKRQTKNHYDSTTKATKKARIFFLSFKMDSENQRFSRSNNDSLKHRIISIAFFVNALYIARVYIWILFEVKWYEKCLFMLVFFLHKSEAQPNKNYYWFDQTFTEKIARAPKYKARARARAIWRVYVVIFSTFKLDYVYYTIWTESKWRKKKSAKSNEINIRRVV